MTNKTTILSASNLLLKSSLSIALLAGLTGCGKRGPSNVSYEEGITKSASLFVPFNGNTQSFDKKVTNKPPREGINLNNLTPYGFNEGNHDIGTWSFWGGSKKYVDFVAKADNNKYYTTHNCTTGEAYVINIILLPLWMLVGFPTDQEGIFEAEDFDSDAKEFLSDNGLDRKRIMLAYEDLLKERDSGESSVKNSLDITSNKMQEIKKTYTEKGRMHPEVTAKYIDHSGFYDKEDIALSLKFISNPIPAPIFLHKYDLQALVDDAFPCQSTDECVTEMAKAKTEVSTTAAKTKKDITAEAIIASAEYEKALKKSSAETNVSYDKTAQTRSFGNKTIHYVVKADNIVKTGAKEMIVNYEIAEMDYNNLFPDYKNSNNDMEIKFDPERKVIKLLNKTDKFIEIDSISLYYNNDIYVLDTNKDKNYAKELSPDSVVEFSLWQDIPNAEYLHLTKAKAQKIDVKFGFAVKYSTDNSSNNKTLYKTEKTNLVSIIQKKS